MNGHFGGDMKGLPEPAARTNFDLSTRSIVGSEHTRAPQTDGVDADSR